MSRNADGFDKKAIDRVGKYVVQDLAFIRFLSSLNQSVLIGAGLSIVTGLFILFAFLGLRGSYISAG